MLNVKYIIGPRLPEDLSGYDERIRRAVEEFREFYSNFNVAYVGREYQVLENKHFLPRASLIYDYKVVDSGEEGLTQILSSSFKSGDIILLEEEDPKINLSTGIGEVNITKSIANEQVLEIETDESAFLIIRENFHPDWECFIDGKIEKIYKANYIFYGVFVPEGNHEVRFVYKSKTFNIASLLSFIGLMIFLSGLVYGFVKKTF
jgi:hypothetical protein